MGFPHLLQNFTAGFNGLPQCPHTCLSGLPQFSQYSASLSFFVPHFGQFMLFSRGMIH